jgi:tetratricopeptide (TPR) repeat protein
MSDIDEAREKLIRQERLRPRPGQHSALWDEGQPWQHAFEELRAIEESHNTRFEHMVAAGQSFEARRDHLQRWSGELNDAAEWHRRLGQQLSNLGKQWPVDPQGRSLAPQELLHHQALAAMRAVDLELRRVVIELEFLEYSRRVFGRLRENEWRIAFGSLQNALRTQGGTYKHCYHADLPDSIYAQRLRWCERVRALQDQTLASWDGAYSGALTELQRDAAALEQLIDPWRPRQLRSSNWMGVVAVVAAVAVVGFFMNGSKKPDTELVAVQSTAAISGKAAVPTANQAAAVPIGDQHALNEEGKQLLKQGQCEAAIRRFQAAFDANPQAHDAYEPLNNMAFCLYELNRHQEAQARWEQALAIEPNSPDAHAGLGMELYVSGRQQEGTDHYRAALGINPNYANEDWLRTTALWSERAISDSRPIRSALGQ